MNGSSTSQEDDINIWREVDIFVQLFVINIIFIPILEQKLKKFERGLIEKFIFDFWFRCKKFRVLLMKHTFKITTHEMSFCNTVIAMPKYGTTSNKYNSCISKNWFFYLIFKNIRNYRSQKNIRTYRSQKLLNRFIWNCDLKDNDMNRIAIFFHWWRHFRF